GPLVVDEGTRIKALGIHDRGVDVREDLELVGDADVVAVRREPVRDRARADLAALEGLDHRLLEGHVPDPPVALDQRRPRLSLMCASSYRPSRARVKS